MTARTESARLRSLLEISRGGKMTHSTSTPPRGGNA